ncbi:murein L,D-transpeptidase catalytic domain family protein [Flavobacterium sp.]|jgi:hypothetical protein|uniref:murein L,D-transpeptidase catalytic domain family protein n=1 Tax=Flavobacterium sp. TaxID=239 RepID=UPI0025D14E83|nr:murein L,D-transpeptidase catalytic domain family protein [Flavobacterium sp.]
MVAQFLTITLFLFTSFTAHLNANPTSTKSKSKKTNLITESAAVALYSDLQTNQYELPKLASFTQALKGFYKLKEKGIIKKDILTLIDFSLSSNVKRLWVIDLASKTILFQSLVAHGRNTGEEFANSFSNAAQSFKSSLGFYATGEVYNGKHGLSLRLDGLEKGINDNARNRGVVMHAADYVSNSFVKNNKRLGRSQGCPAVPVALSKEIISAIKDKSCLFIYHPKLVSSLSS